MGQDMRRATLVLTRRAIQLAWPATGPSCKTPPAFFAGPLAASTGWAAVRAPGRDGVPAAGGRRSESLVCQQLPARYLPVRLVGMGVSGLDDRG